ncbi:hypothetical protein L861_06705 [Litchfieldella anticariensis FP35 = DSM 16096]|uniref:Uncharacterized protein n=1 Tax=Litchfieldella anticariensis (strain DSM 16096 / CECT 5854 / CIP 108499 / LMG 22089 / FP35) TaxID=1121939 RepID=S2KFC8_LITA3|nr:hypothetical protein [Halomonas anticariensis]EPC00625.1 hypothetical protein L861_06705 [Halomonas anticariensis FP35 = DSM 16096]
MCLRERLPRKKAGEHHQTAKQLLKGSVAFTSALLFGNGETKGLVRTLGAASLEAGKNAYKVFFHTPAQSSTEEEESLFDPWDADTSDPRTNRTMSIYYNASGERIYPFSYSGDDD